MLCKILSPAQGDHEMIAAGNSNVFSRQRDLYLLICNMIILPGVMLSVKLEGRNRCRDNMVEALFGIKYF
jgi:hypothetical protein